MRRNLHGVAHARRPVILTAAVTGNLTKPSQYPARPVIPAPGDPRNATDPRAILMGGAFSRSIGQPCAATDDVSGVYRFDIVVGGRNALYFE